METNSNSGLINFMSLLCAILSVIDSIVHFVFGIKNLNESNDEKSTNTYIIVLMIFRLLAAIQYIGLEIVSRKINVKDYLRLISTVVYATIVAIVMILSCFVINFRDNTISLILHIICNYLAFADVFKLLVIKFLNGYQGFDQNESNKKFAKKSPIVTVLKVLDDNILALSTLLTVIVAVLLGFILKETDPDWSDRQIKYVGFIGEIFLRMLKCLILPLIFSSLVFAMGNIDTKLAGGIGFRTVFYYLSTTVLAIILGIILVLSIRPGVSEDGKTVDKHVESLTVDTVLDLMRNLFPDNIVEASFSTFKTVLIPTNVTNVTLPNGTVLNETLPIEEWEISSSKINGTNILGIVVFAIILGVVIGRMKEEGQVLVDFFKAFNNAMMTITELVIHLTPIAVLFLVLPQILEVEQLSDLLGSIGWYTLTVLIGLFIHGFIILPAIYFVCTRKNPYSYLVHLSAAMMTAFGTASSSATMPVTFQCLEERIKIDKRIVRFCIPVGATINMDGTALYEAVAVIFIAQYRNIELDVVQVIIIAITATAASIGAAGIPQAGLITMVIVLNAVGFPAEDAALIFVIDWLIDRFRTAINVLGDAYGAGIVEHLSKKDLEKFNFDE